MSVGPADGLGDLVSRVLTSRPREVDGALEFLRALSRAPAAPSASVAMLGGAIADRIGYAFLAGYHGALLALVPDLDRTRATALAVTEASGTHPRAIETRLQDDLLYGDKTFVTMGTEAQVLLVLAHEGIDAAGQRRLRLCQVAVGTEGVSLEPAPPTTFVPEIPHARVHLDGAKVERVLEGDGWADYVRPFRTVEDTHVHLALVSYLLASGARFGFAASLLEPGLGALAALYSVAHSDPNDRGIHLALAGAMRLARDFIDTLDDAWSTAPEAERARYLRDRPILNVAAKAREARRTAAWSALER